MTNSQPFRQVHLDFHTSEDIAGIGSAFDPDVFAATLEQARVNSINCFARCHHGWMYYDTQAFPERRHPHLTRNLLREQIEACHARGIRVPLYTTVKWDRLTAAQHPEWLTMAPDGTIHNNDPFGPGFYANLCLNTPYVEFLRQHVQEMFSLLPVDGVWFDIMFPSVCVCPHCRADMIAQGLDPADPQVQRHHARFTVERFQRDMTAFIRQFSADCLVFYNAGHVGPEHRAKLATYTDLELESLPSGSWGYLHFPLAMRYARTLGIECLGMTGKFHTAWGDFHSLKNEAALQFECFRMLALGAKCSVGDQLHPTGRMDQPTYDLIGSVFSEVEQKEPWCREVQPLAEIGVMMPEEFTGEHQPASALGAVRMLQEGAHQFDMVDSASDFSNYQALVLPDEIPVSKELAVKLNQYLSDGGTLLASYRSGLSPEGDRFALPLGVTLKGEAPFSPDFIRANAGLAKGMPTGELVMYLRGMEVTAAPGSETLADVITPYFNRGLRFCSHRHTPSSGKVGYPGVVGTGKTIYFCHPIFTQYQQNAPRWCKQLFLNALELLLPEPLVRTSAPTTALVTVNSQSQENRWVLHLLHYIPERRGQEFDVIEDVIPLFQIAVSLRVPQAVQHVRCVPGERQLEFQQTANRLEFVVPEVNGHQMVAIEFT